MRVKVIMMPVKNVHCISMDQTIGEAMQLISDHNLLSLPVVDGKKFIGVLSKQHTYESFFKKYDCSKEEFLQHKVPEMMRVKIDTITKDTRIEEAAAMFISSKARFLPVTDEKGNLEGIVTQQAIFKEYQKLFGTKYNSVTILCNDFKGMLSRVTEVIAKNGGNIKNFVQVDTEIMDIQELHISIEADNFQNVVDALKKNKFDIRNVKYVDK